MRVLVVLNCEMNLSEMSKRSWRSTSFNGQHSGPSAWLQIGGLVGGFQEPGRANMNEKTWNVPSLLRTFITQAMKLPSPNWIQPSQPYPHTPLHFLPMGLVGWPRLLLNYSSFISRHLAWHTPRHPTLCREADSLPPVAGWWTTNTQTHRNTKHQHAAEAKTPVDWAFQVIWAKANAKAKAKAKAKPEDSGSGNKAISPQLMWAQFCSRAGFLLMAMGYWIDWRGRRMRGRAKGWAKWKVGCSAAERKVVWPKQPQPLWSCFLVCARVDNNWFQNIN